MDTFDVVMWAKNGERTLPYVLNRIERVIPQEHVNQKIIVDDGSTDATKEIAKNLGWQVISNEGDGISDGANTALKHVETDRFISFEQDLLLCKDWWTKVPPLLNASDVAIASGIRFQDNPLSVRKLEQYVASRSQNQSLIKTHATRFLPKSLDNTMYKTDVLRKVGGFPKMRYNAGFETMLARTLPLYGWKWKVHFYAQSTHLRSSLRHVLAHEQWYATANYDIRNKLEAMGMSTEDYADDREIFSRFVISPFTGVLTAYKVKYPMIAAVYPLMKAAVLKGLIVARKGAEKQ